MIECPYNVPLELALEAVEEGCLAWESDAIMKNKNKLVDGGMYLMRRFM